MKATRTRAISISRHEQGKLRPCWRLMSVIAIDTFCCRMSTVYMSSIRYRMVSRLDGLETVDTVSGAGGFWNQWHCMATCTAVLEHCKS